MRVKRRTLRRLCLSLAGVCVLASQANAQGTDVTAQVKVKFVGAASEHHSNEGVVFWLTPADDAAAVPSPRSTKNHFQLAQRNKQFLPHVLVVPVGSIVDFPNMDPFFHNVFSLFNGKRFDLGLYESGSTRRVHFDRAGVSYIFCNIHPEMSAVVVAVPTTYYAVSSSTGALVIRDVAPGAYVAHLWAMGESGANAEILDHRLNVSGKTMDVGALAITESAVPAHKNKFGEDYDNKKSSSY